MSNIIHNHPIVINPGDTIYYRPKYDPLGLSGFRKVVAVNKDIIQLYCGDIKLEVHRSECYINSLIDVKI